jgi:hypothetical protein
MSVLIEHVRTDYLTVSMASGVETDFQDNTCPIIGSSTDSR